MWLPVTKRSKYAPGMFSSLTETYIRSRLKINGTIEQPLLLSDHVEDNSTNVYGEPLSSLPVQDNMALRPAAVLVPLLRQGQDWHLLYIRRTEMDDDMHSGQVAFPGGGAEDGEEPESAALREAYEEIGLLPKNVSLMGRLSPLKTISAYVITPVVGIIRYPYSLTPSPLEVSEVFTIPLTWLADGCNYEERDVTIEISNAGRAYKNMIRVIYYIAYGGNTLWGASARITQNLLEKLLTGL